MVNELDFEEIDQALEDMSNLDGITNAIAEDVAKIDHVVKNTTSKKEKKSSKNVVKNTTKKSKASEKTSSKPKKTSKSETKETNVDNNDGEIVMVKVKKKPVPEPEEVVHQPNPKTGKFMDIVSPLSDMSIKGVRPSKQGGDSIDEVLISETSMVTEVTTVVADNSYMEKDDIILDRERIEGAGLDPDAAIGDLSDQLEDISSDISEEPFGEILQSFTSDTSEKIANEIADDVSDDLERLADILDIPDHSDAFLENVSIEKRPLGGESELPSAVAAIDGTRSVANTIKDEVSEKSVNNDIDESEKLSENNKKNKKSNKAKSNKSAKKSSSTVLYVLLVILFVILGSSLGVLAYFSGLF
jgi:hypothetical protein